MLRTSEGDDGEPRRAGGEIAQIRSRDGGLDERRRPRRPDRRGKPQALVGCDARALEAERDEMPTQERHRSLEQRGKRIAKQSVRMSRLPRYRARTLAHRRIRHGAAEIDGAAGERGRAGSARDEQHLRALLAGGERGAGPCHAAADHHHVRGQRHGRSGAPSRGSAQVA